MHSTHWRVYIVSQLIPCCMIFRSGLRFNSLFSHTFSSSLSSGAILDQPPSYDDDSDEGSAPTVILSQTLSSEACQIHIDASEGLAGYLLTGVEVLSGARTVEVYDSAAGGEYIGTSRGALAEKRRWTNAYTKAYSCLLHVNVPLRIRKKCFVVSCSELRKMYCLHTKVS